MFFSRHITRLVLVYPDCVRWSSVVTVGVSCIATLAVQNSDFCVVYG